LHEDVGRVLEVLYGEQVDEIAVQRVEKILNAKETGASHGASRPFRAL
jgi:hypothetical protein